MLEMKCENEKISLALEDEKLSMIIAGKSRMGKTYFASLLGNMLISRGASVHLIDLGSKWSDADKQKLTEINAKIYFPGKDEIILAFHSKKELLGCSQCICNALGFRSENAKVALKSAIRKLIEQEASGFSLKGLLEILEESAPKDEWSAKLYEHFESMGEIPEIRLEINEVKAYTMNDSSTIWDLIYLEESLGQVIAYLILYSILCTQKKRFRNRVLSKKIFVIVDEFQNFNLSQRSMIDICMTEGQKYKLYLILATQFLQGKFSDVVYNQLLQCGFQIYFRMLEDDAHHICKQITRDSKEYNILYNRLINLQGGQCLFIGSHKLGSSENIVESARFIKITDVNSN